jgi:hypothetical protein
MFLRRTTLVIVGATALATLISLPAQAASLRRNDLVCNAMHTFSVPGNESAKAAQIMAGKVSMGTYGTMKLTQNPNWKKQSTLDLAGNRYQHSLHWALPLLREGTRGGLKGDAMTARFTDILHDWVDDNPVAQRSSWVNHPQYGGFRLGTWVCAHRLLTDQETLDWVAGQARIDLAVQLRGFTTRGANNTMLNSQIAAFAAAEEVGTADQQTQALNNISALRTTLMNKDGSDIEGAPGYGSYLSQVLVRAERVLRAYGARWSADRIRLSVDRQADFLAQSTRPDRYIESIGDGALRRISAGVFPEDASATWVLSNGEQGDEPTQTYSRWQGGYVFGRSGWVAGTDESSSYYSLRTSTMAPATAHRHLDTTGVTFYSNGVSWIGDPGPYRYDTSALRSFITRRAAHSALIATEPKTAGARGVLLPGRPSAAADKSCVRDLSYEQTGRIGLTRCVYYLRTIDVLVVQDLVSAPKNATTVTQQWVLSPAVKSAEPTEPEGGLTLTGVTATGKLRTARLLTDGPATVSAAGPLLGQFGTIYAERRPGSVIQQPIAVPAGGSRESFTAVAPGDRALALGHGISASGRPTVTVTAGTDRQTFVLAL